MIIIRELHVHVEFIAYVVAGNLLFKARDETAGTQSQRIVFALAAFKSFAVDKAFEIDFSGIAHSSRTIFNNDHAGVAIANLFDFGIHIGIGHFYRGLRHFNTFVAFDFNFRLYRNGSLEGEAVFGQVVHIKINLVINISHAGLVDGGLQGFG